MAALVGLAAGSLDHSDLITFTNTRVPSLRTGVDFVRLTRAMIRDIPVGCAESSPVVGSTKANVFST
jgi:hypothetical protein